MTRSNHSVVLRSILLSVNSGLCGLAVLRQNFPLGDFFLFLFRQKKKLPPTFQWPIFFAEAFIFFTQTAFPNCFERISDSEKKSRPCVGSGCSFFSVMRARIFVGYLSRAGRPVGRLWQQQRGLPPGGRRSNTRQARSRCSCPGMPKVGWTSAENRGKKRTRLAGRWTDRGSKLEQVEKQDIETWNSCSTFIFGCCCCRRYCFSHYYCWGGS